MFSSKKILHNKVLLYLILFISLADLYYFAITKDFMSVSIFILLGIIISFFNKNMLIILFLALTATNVLKYGSNIRHEGFDGEDQEDKGDKEEEEFSFLKDEDEEEDKSENKEEKKKKTKKDKLLENVKEIMQIMNVK